MTRAATSPQALGYLRASRAPLHAWLAVAPLVLLHATAVAVFDPPVRAAAAGWVHAPLRALGLTHAQAALTLALLFVGIGLVMSARAIRAGRLRLRPHFVALSWGEGATWGLALHLAVSGAGAASQRQAGLGPGDELTLALGAGIYEEVVFRVLLYAAAYMLIDGVLRLRAGARGRPPRPARRAGVVLGAVLLTSLAFALAHHLGAEAPTVGAIVFRMLAALYLTSIYALRGLGVAVVAHATYDIFVAFGTAWPGS